MLKNICVKMDRARIGCGLIVWTLRRRQQDIDKARVLHTEYKARKRAAEAADEHNRRKR